MRHTDASDDTTVPEHHDEQAPRLESRAAGDLRCMRIGDRSPIPIRRHFLAAHGPLTVRLPGGYSGRRSLAKACLDACEQPRTE